MDPKGLINKRLRPKNNFMFKTTESKIQRFATISAAFCNVIVQFSTVWC